MGDQDNPLKDVVEGQPKKLSPESEEKRAPIEVMAALRLIDGLELRATAMTVDEVSQLLQVSARHVYQLVKDGKIPHFKVGSAVRFDPDELKKWLVASSTKSPFY